MAALRGLVAVWVLLGSVVTGSSIAGPVPEAVEAALAQGLELYDQGQFTQAWHHWRSILEQGYASAELLLNLGNAAYKSGEIGWANYYYELARRESPGDPDILSNLSLARREALGPERAPERSAILAAIATIQNRSTLGDAVRLAGVAFWVATGLMLLSWIRFRAGRGLLLLRGVALGIILFSGLAVGVKWFQGALMPEAMAVRPLAVRSEPREDATVEFRLPEGSPVSLDRRSPGWREIVVSKSLRGWVPSEAVALFSDPGAPVER